MTEKTLRIGAVARGAETDTATVRRYARLNLLDYARDSTGALLFGREAIDAVKRIKALRIANRGPRAVA